MRTIIYDLHDLIIRLEFLGFWDTALEFRKLLAVELEREERRHVREIGMIA